MGSFCCAVDGNLNDGMGWCFCFEMSGVGLLLDMAKVEWCFAAFSSMLLLLMSTLLLLMRGWLQ
jgi:hypothetical protein